MSNEGKITGLGNPKPPEAFGIKFELPVFRPKINVFKELKKIEKPVEKNISQELHDSWSNVIPNLSQQFFNEITEISRRLNCNPEDFAALMFNESRFNPRADGGKYHGLIQMDETALKASTKHAFETMKENCKLDKNITMQKYINLSREEQLKYAEAYLQFRIDEKHLNGKKLTGGQLWTLIKRPASINNKKFVAKVQHQIDSIKQIPLKYETPYSIKHKD